jgi:hypothetical protein
MPLAQPQEARGLEQQQITPVTISVLQAEIFWVIFSLLSVPKLQLGNNRGSTSSWASVAKVRLRATDPQ